MTSRKADKVKSSYTVMKLLILLIVKHFAFVCVALLIHLCYGIIRVIV